MLCAPANAFRSRADRFKFTEQTAQLSANCRFECRAREEIPFLFGPECGQQLVGKEFDVPRRESGTREILEDKQLLSQRMKNSYAVDVRTSYSCLQDKVDQHSTPSSLLRLARVQVAGKVDN